MTVILPQFHHCDCEMCEWLILELFSNFRALCESMHDFSCIVDITIATATPTMLWCNSLSLHAPWNPLHQCVLTYWDLYIYIYICQWTDACIYETNNKVIRVCWWGKGWPVVASPSWALVVLYRMLTIFACYVLTYVWDAVSILTTTLGCFCPRTLLFEQRTEQFTMDLIFTCYTKDDQQGCFRLSNWFSLRRLGPWMKHLPPAW